MSKSVGITCGIGTQLLLDDHPAVKRSGVAAPYDKIPCDALRKRFELEGIILVGKTLPLPK